LSYGTVASGTSALYHCQYEKFAVPPSLFRTVFGAPATNPKRPVSGGAARNRRAPDWQARAMGSSPLCCMRHFCYPPRHESVTFWRTSIQNAGVRPRALGAPS